MKMVVFFSDEIFYLCLFSTMRGKEMCVLFGQPNGFVLREDEFFIDKIAESIV